jgi:hypothetical protein
MKNATSGWLRVVALISSDNGINLDHGVLSEPASHAQATHTGAP